MTLTATGVVSALYNQRVHASRLTIGRYVLSAPIASGGMGTVYLGTLSGPGGFSRVVALKRLHEQYAASSDFRAAFLDEARLSARVRHPNVVSVVDIVEDAGELWLVMDYVAGESLATLLRRSGGPISPAIAVGIVAGTLHGLHAAHEVTDDVGAPLGIVHRDVSPQNVIVGADGVARIADFGIAKASDRLQSTRDGQLKGKIAYMAPEQVAGADVDRQVDVYAAGVVLWEALVGRRLFVGDNQADLLRLVLEAEIPTPSATVPTIPVSLDEVVMRALERHRERRYQTAREMALALERALAPATTTAIGAWVEELAGNDLRTRAQQIAGFDSTGAAMAQGRSPPAAAVDATVAATAATAPAAPPKAARRMARKPLLLAVAMVAIALVVAVAGAARERAAHAPTPASPRDTPAGTPEPTKPTPPTSTTLRALPDAATEAPPPNAATTRTGTTGSTSSIRARGKRVHKAQPPARAPDCTPPYIEDAAGIRRPKPECL